MIFRWPLVRPNQRVIPLDFERLTAAAEDLIAHIAQHVLVDTTDATYKDMGIVLWGLAASSVNGNPATVTVSPGAALVPNNGGDSRWRLVYLTGTYTAHLDAPGAGTRTDLIRIKLDPATEDAGSAEERDYRRVNDDGSEEIYSFTEPRFRLPTAVPSVLANVGGGANPLPGAGYVRLHTAAVTSAGVVTLTDFRRFLFSPPTGWDPTAVGGGKYYRGLRPMLQRMVTALSGVITYDGKLKTSVPMADGGPPIQSNNNFGAWLELGSRMLRTAFDAYARRFLINESTLDQASTWTAPTNGFGLFAGNVIRAAVIVQVISDAEADPEDPDFATARWQGFNVSNVVRESAGEYTIIFPAAVGQGTDDYGGITDGGMAVIAVPHVDNPGLPDTEADRDPNHPNFGFAQDPRIITARFVIEGNGQLSGLKVRTYQFMDNDNSQPETAFRVPYVRDRSFTILVVGPVTKAGTWTPVD